MNFENIEQLYYFVKRPYNMISYLDNVAKYGNTSNTTDKVDWFDTFIGNNKILINAKRQCGKTFGLCVFALWYALFKSDKVVAISSYSKDMTKLMIDTIDSIYKALPDYLKSFVKYRKKNNSIEVNESRIVGFNITKNQKSEIHGMGPDLFILDDFAFWKDYAVDTFLKAYYPCIVSKSSSKLIIASTPNGFNDFYNIYSNSNKNGFAIIEEKDKFNTNDKKIKNLINMYGEKFVRQEFCCQFFNSDRIRQ